MGLHSCLSIVCGDLRESPLSAARLSCVRITWGTKGDTTRGVGNRAVQATDRPANTHSPPHRCMKPHDETSG